MASGFGLCTEERAIPPTPPLPWGHMPAGSSQAGWNLEGQAREDFSEPGEGQECLGCP